MADGHPLRIYGPVKTSLGNLDENTYSLEDVVNILEVVLKSEARLKFLL